MTPRLRVIAGTLGGRRFAAPAGIRPTTDRVREAVFASLGQRVHDATVLDLCAGSGAFGIEALSRGAVRAVLVDADHRAVRTCRENLASLGLGDRARVQSQTMQRFLAATAPPEAPFDLVGCDPPYDHLDAEIVATLAALSAPGWLAPGALVVVERRVPPRNVSPSEWPDLLSERGAGGWSVAWERSYGDTLVRALEISEA